MKILTVVGARPQFVKAVSVSRILREAHEEVLVHTGQHYDERMSEVFFRELGIPEPEYNLEVGSAGHSIQTGEMLIRMEPVFMREKPNWVLVYGDTNSTLAGALVASKLKIPIAHVEAGLRSFNRGMPEEINRVVTDHVSDLLFCPTQVSVENLSVEGIRKGVHQVGDVMYDALLHNLVLARQKSTISRDLKLPKGQYALATIHRAANTDDGWRMASIMDALGKLSLPVVFPIHPRTRKMMNEWGISAGRNIMLMEPVGYFDMLSLMECANCILTDSGGVQKEAYLIGVRCITLREETEWVETVSAGWNQLAGADGNKIIELFENWFPRGDRLPFYGDGHTSEKICSILLDFLQ